MAKGKVHMPASLWFCWLTFFRSFCCCCCWCFLIFFFFVLCLLALAKATFARFDCVKFLWLFDFFTYWPRGRASHESWVGREGETGRKRRSSVASQAFLVPQRHLNNYKIMDGRSTGDTLPQPLVLGAGQRKEMACNARSRSAIQRFAVSNANRA